MTAQIKPALADHLAYSPRGSGAIAITGAKGGIGKSTLGVNLAVALGNQGRRVLLVDGDLGLANLDVLLGLTAKYNVEHLVRGEVGLDDVLIDGPHGVRVLPAASGVPSLSRMRGESRDLLLAALAEGTSQVDDTIVDTGAGLGETSLILQLAASRVVLVTTPEPTSLVDSYATLKVLWASDPDKRVDLVVNAVTDEQEAWRTYLRIGTAAREFLGQVPGWLGPVYQDSRVRDAVQRQRPLLELYPNCPAARCYERIAGNLAHSLPTGSGDADYWGRIAEIEGEVAH